MSIYLHKSIIYHLSVYYLCPSFSHRVFDVVYKNACKYNKTGEEKSESGKTKMCQERNKIKKE